MVTLGRLKVVSNLSQSCLKGEGGVLAVARSFDIAEVAGTACMPNCLHTYVIYVVVGSEVGQNGYIKVLAELITETMENRHKDYNFVR